jgi:hypothetical protein
MSTGQEECSTDLPPPMTDIAPYVVNHPQLHIIVDHTAPAYAATSSYAASEGTPKR